MTRSRGVSLLLALLGLAVTTLTAPAQASPPAMRRLAVVVGSNDPPSGQQALRFAHDDANELAGVLEQVGGFAPADVRVLLDPHPTELLGALDGVARATSDAGGNVLFVFYYSGHSDGRALFPHGEPLLLADVRERVEHLGARIRVGILDTCRGGSWTQSKGLTVGPPLSMADLLNVDTEGTALVSSSSGFENAHEAEAVHGSFFTHYFAAGLRGAADRKGDGNITLQEAFEYARERTIGDSARLAKTPQHPSFDLALRGRQDIVLSILSSSTSALEVTAARAPIEIIQLSTGVTVADAPLGPNPLRIALPPGRYLVRSLVGGRVYTKDIEVRSGETAVVADAQLEATGGEPLAMKGPPEPQVPLSLWGPRRGTRWLLHLDAGAGAEAAPPTNLRQNQAGQQSFSSFTAGYSLWYRITDRLSWSVPWPAFTYRFGTPGSVEVMPYLGLRVDGWNSVTGLSGSLQGDVSARIWTARNQWISLAAGAAMAPALAAPQVEPFGRVGYGWSLKGLVTLSANVGLDRDYAYGSSGWQYHAEWLRIGGNIGVRVAPRVVLDLTAGWSTETQGGTGSYPGFLVGTTIAF